MRASPGSGRYALLLQRVRSVPGLGKDVSAVVVIVVLGIVVSGFLLVNQRMTWPWQSEFLFHAEFASVPGIAPGRGQEVRIAGVPVGEIERAEVSERGTAMLTLSIRTEDRIFDNARLVLRSKTPLNEMYVTIAPGGPPGHPLEEGATLGVDHTEQPVPVDDVLSHLDVKARDAMTAMLSESDVALANMPENLPPGLTAADDTLNGVRPVVEALRTRTERIQTLVDSLSRISTSVGGNDVRLASIANSLQSTLGTIAAKDDKLVATLDQLPDASAQLRRATAGTDQLSGQLDPTLDKLHEAAGQLPGSLANLEDTVDQVGETVDAARPFVHLAKPVVSDLRPFAADLRGALDELEPSTARLDTVTSGVLPYLLDLKAFAAQTASLTSVRDANSHFFRGRLTVAPETVPFAPQSLQRAPKEPPGR